LSLRGPKARSNPTSRLLWDETPSSQWLLRGETASLDEKAGLAVTEWGTKS